MVNRIDELTVQVAESDTVSARIYPAARNHRKAVTIILGHGAGANQLSSFMQLVAGGLAARGLDAMTFNFLYTERGRRVPDPKAKLESCYLSVIEAAQKRKQLKDNRLIIGGKSMGGRIASQVAAALSDPGSAISGPAAIEIKIDGLVFLGYPLHPPGRPEKLRAEHLKKVRAPMLFAQGARDAFGTPDEIRAVMRTHRFKGEIFPIEGGDHSFKVPRTAAVSQQQVYELVMDKIVSWLPA
jgi:predicted alpha/beta-hydrolase family hydrolase